MRCTYVVLLAGILASSASTPHDSFHYEITTSFHRSEDRCRICYGDDCTTLDQPRCEYYVEMDDVIDKPEEEGQVTEVDGMMYDLTQEATMSWTTQQCLPLVSQYTDCNKDNFCTGCKECRCNEDSQWSCRQVQRCRAETKLEVDHRVLDMVIQKLMSFNDTTVRRKRSGENVTKSEVTQISLLDIAEWMYGVRPNVNFEKQATSSNVSSSTQSSTTLSKPTDSEYLDFEEVLKNIAIEDQNNKKRKSQLKDNNDTIDYMDLELDDDKFRKSKASDLFMNVLNALEEGKNITEATDDSTLFVDLFPRANNNDFYDDYNATDNLDNIPNMIYKEENSTNDTSNDKIELNSVNIMKRDVSSKNDLNNTPQATNATTASFETTVDKESDLNNNVLIPLTNVIDDKQNEVKELLQIKESLMRFIKVFNNTVNFTKESEVTNGSSTYFSIYKLDLFPEIQEDLRRSNTNVLEKLLYKLKRDIYEVLRDIAGIQKLSRARGLPDDLKMLVRSMKYYVNKQGSVRNFKKKDIKLESYKNARRVLMKSNTGKDTTNTIRKQITDILEVLDKDSPQSNAWEFLSKAVKKIIKRVIKQTYVDDFAVIGLKVIGTEYNLTKDLSTIGKSWAGLIADLESCSPHEKLYAMKFLHFTLSGDINRIRDAVSLVNFAHSRRMIPIEITEAEELMSKINIGLSSIQNKVNILMKYHKAQTRHSLRDKADQPNNNIKKESFLKRLRNMLRKSKKDIVDMAKKKIPKSEIFKTIAKKELNERSRKKLFDDEQTMLKWQSKLNLARREKRDLKSRISHMKNRLKNIIPKYLRGKINPAIAKPHKPKKHFASKKKNTSKNKHVASTTKKTILKTTLKKQNTTPKSN